MMILPSDDACTSSAVNPQEGQNMDGAIATGERRRHTSFYAHRAPVILLVENTLYSVDKTILSQFQVFKDMFECAGEFNKNLTEGLSDDNPIQLQGVTTFEMDSLLNFFNPIHLLEKSSSLDGESWKAILYLATMWDFAKLRDLAIEAIEKLDFGPMDMIMLSRKCNVQQWLTSAYVALCTRAEPITLDEARVLGLDFAFQLIAIRETTRYLTRCRNCGSSCYHTKDCVGFKDEVGQPRSKLAWQAQKIKSMVDGLLANSDL
ncbi:hypothetical protein FRC03_002587 [Tulasnella sp. 419]|nr:hypothetical protein FRC03_002587 [Tulasnella sp. 419]